MGLYLAFWCKSTFLFIPDNSPWCSALTVENISCIILFVLLLDEGMDTVSHHTQWPLPSGQSQEDQTSSPCFQRPWICPVDWSTTSPVRSQIHPDYIWVLGLQTHSCLCQETLRWNFGCSGT